MFQNLKVRLALIAALLLLSVGFLYRNYVKEGLNGEPVGQIVNLGLDLQGGSHFALELDEAKTKLTPEQRADAIQRALRVVRMRVEGIGAAEPLVQQVGTNRMVVELAGIHNQADAKAIIQKTAFLKFQIVRPLEELAAVLPRVDAAAAAAGIGGKQASQPAAATPGGLFEQKGDTARAAGPDSLSARPFTSKIQPAAPGTFAVARTDTALVSRVLALPAVQRMLPRGSTLLWGVPEQKGSDFIPLYYLEADPIMTGEYLEDASAQPDQFNRPVVVFELSRRGGRDFEKATGEHINEQMAIVLDDKVQSAPTIQSQIGSRGQIDLGGTASLEEASDLALVLRAGALPAPLRIVEERSVGPTLGQDSVDSGTLAGIIGICGVILLMLAYYRIAGAFAVTGLTLYVVFILGALAALGADLTFPGIAGLILSIGMAVDANVLIFERIREELAAGRNPRVAVEEGFKNAMSAIVDSNLTTLITAAILYGVGTGPVRGFAITLAVGIIASMFTAIFVVRTLFLMYLGRRSGARALSI